MQWESVIGLEVHVQLATKSKLFSGAATTFGAEPNTQACAVDLALPGILPVPNKEAVRMAIKFGVAINAEIAKHSVFARKNYFYPDLPKGYQISQYEFPIVCGGYLEIQVGDNDTKRINITRAHLEEDAGKSLHEDFHGMTGIDLNRAGTPLIEIVSEPDMRSAAEAVAYLKSLHALVRYLEISDANMQEGSFRCDANVSVRPVGSTTFGTRTEIKNLNSFRFIEKAIDYEIKRQINLLESGEQVMQETRLYDADNDLTRSMRSKEEAEDYRYFPDPDLMPIAIDDEFIAASVADLPELPQAKRHRFCTEYNLSTYDADILAYDRKLADYFENTLGNSGVTPKLAANWIIGEITAALNQDNISITECPITPDVFAKLLLRIEDNTLSGKTAKIVFDALWKGKDGSDVDAIIEAKGLKQITDEKQLTAIIETVLNENPEQVKQYREGKTQVFGFLIGKTMQATKNRANPQLVNKLLTEALNLK